MHYDVQVNLKTDSQRRIKFKHAAELGGATVTTVINDFMQMYIDKKLKPEDVKKLSVN